MSCVQEVVSLISARASLVWGEVWTRTVTRRRIEPPERSRSRLSSADCCRRRCSLFVCALFRRLGDGASCQVMGWIWRLEGFGFEGSEEKP